jgi:alkylation response protein AidB-like acyl-CoA dehydrogenase
MLFPADQALFTDVWDVIGLRATGSDTYSVSDLFIQEDHAVIKMDPGVSRNSGLLYRFTTGSLYAAGFASIAIGIARALLDSLTELATGKTPMASQRALKDSPVLQFGLGQAEGRLRAARSLLLGTVEDMWQSVSSQHNLSIEHRVMARLAATHAIHEAGEVADYAYHAAGANAIFTNGSYERRLRDMHTVAQQAQGRSDHYETVGQFLLGLNHDMRFM